MPDTNFTPGPEFTPAFVEGSLGSAAVAGLVGGAELELDLPFYLGHGFRRYAGKLGQRVVDQSKLKSTLTSDARVETRFGLIASKEEFESAFSADASLAGSGGGFSAEARASLSKKYSRESTQVTIAFTKRVVRGIQRLHEFPLTADAKKTAKAADKFLLAYGDELVTGVGRGGACCYLFQYAFNSEKEAREFKLSISARYGSGRGSYSQEQKERFLKTKATVSFSGYTTGTLNVPDLFPEEVVDGTSFLFSRDLSDRMISGLLHYFDSFQEYFRDSTDDLAQVLILRESYGHLPTVFPKSQQDKIALTGSKAAAIAEALWAQESAIEESRTKLEYMLRELKDFNRPQDLSAAGTLLQQVHAVAKLVEQRQDALRNKLDVTTGYDFTGAIPAIPAHFCTADPEHYVTPRNGLPNGWTALNFSIHPRDYHRACRISARASIYAVKHRPNGGSATLQLVSVPLHQLSGVDRPEQAVTGLGTGQLQELTVVDEVKLNAPSRGRSDGGLLKDLVFVPALDGVMYQVRVHCQGNNPGRRVILETHVGRS